MILMHLCWSLWAYSFSHVAVPPLFDLSFVLQYTVVPVTKVLGLSDGVDTIVTRVTQVWLAVLSLGSASDATRIGRACPAAGALSSAPSGPCASDSNSGCRGPREVTTPQAAAATRCSNCTANTSAPQSLKPERLMCAFRPQILPIHRMHTVESASAPMAHTAEAELRHVMSLYALSCAEQTWRGPNNS
jgi:hypothetical protein